jgi:hypothetical protein
VEETRGEAPQRSTCAAVPPPPSVGGAEVVKVGRLLWGPNATGAAAGVAAIILALEIGIISTIFEVVEVVIFDAVSIIMTINDNEIILNSLLRTSTLAINTLNNTATNILGYINNLTNPWPLYVNSSNINIL